MSERSHPIPEAGFPVRPCRHFFEIQPPADFAVGRAAEMRHLAHFETMDMSFQVAAPLKAVWRAYTTTNPLRIWDDAWSRVVAVHVPSRRRTLDRVTLATGWRRFEKGMKVFLDMAVAPVPLLPVPAMMVGLQVVRLDAARKVIEFRYLEGSPSYGKQIMSFRPSPEDPSVTLISHRTWYRSYFRLVELVYPLYHDRMIRNMHRRFQEVIHAASSRF